MLPRWYSCGRRAGTSDFHYFCYRGLLPGERFEVREDELPFLQALGKEVFFYTYGADVRTRRKTLRPG